MWSDTKQQHLDDLRRRAQHGSLTPDEQQTLDLLLHELEQQEWVTLRPALDRLHQDHAQIQNDLSQLQAQNAALSALVERYADLVARAGVELIGLTNERDALHAEYNRALL